MSARRTYCVILVGTVAWCSGVLLAPVLVAAGGLFTDFGTSIYRFFDPVCHQIGERSLHILGKPLAVCARCSSIYGAFLLGTILYPAVHKIRMSHYPPRIILLVAAVPMVMDAFFGMMGLHTVTSLTRLLSGAVFGLVTPFFVIPTAVEALQQIFPRVVSVPFSKPQKGQPNA